MSYGTVQAEKMTTESGYSLGAGNASSFKNRIINGDMRISQRGTSFTGLPNGAIDYYACDRWKVETGGLTAGPLTFNITQDSDGPTGLFNKSYKFTVTSVPTTFTASSYFMLTQKIEACNIQDVLNSYGTANAKPVTVSLWVKTNVANTVLSVGFRTFATSGGGYSNFYGTTIATPNTWQQLTFTFPGLTAATSTAGLTDTGLEFYVTPYAQITNATTAQNGVWENTNRLSGPGGNSQTWITTANATLQITGVQFEVGTVATSFDYRPYTTELQLCQRYAFTYNNSSTGTNVAWGLVGWGIAASSTNIICCFQPPVQMRVVPTSVTVDSIGNFAATNFNSSFTLTNLALNGSNSTFLWVEIEFTTSSLSTGSIYMVRKNNTGNNGILTISAEL